MKYLYSLSILCLCYSFSLAQWSNIYDNQKVQYLDGHVTRQIVVSDNEGGCFVIWQDARDQINVDQVYAQHFDSTGTPSWAENGIALSPTTKLQNQMVAISDGQGGVFIIWRDLRDTTNNPNSTGPDIWGQRIDKTGTLWGNGIGLIVEPGEQGAPLIVSDGAGGFIFSFEDGGDFMAPRSEGYWMQRVDANGAPQWGAGGKLVHQQSSTFSTSIDLALAPDGQNGAVLVYNEAAFNMTTGHNIYGHRMNQAGTRMWSPVADTIAGIVIERGYPISVEPGSQTNPIVHLDEQGNVIVSWQDKRNPAWQHGALFAQRLQPDGSLLWNANGVQISPSGMGAANRFGMIPDMKGGVYFEYATSGHQVHDLIRYKLDGTQDWTNPINIASNMAYNSPLKVSPKGEVALVWLATSVNQGSEDGIMAQIIDTTGAELSAGGILMSSYPEDKGPAAMDLGSNGEIFTSWIDWRRTNGQSGSNADADLFVQGLSRNSISLNDELVVHSFAFDLIQGSDRMTVNFEKALMVDANIRLVDLQGRILCRSIGYSGESESSFFMPQLASGIYLVAVEYQSMYAAKKFFHP